MKNRLNMTWMIAMLLTVAGGCEKQNGGPEPAIPEYPAEVLDYNYVLGTQTIGPAYKFTADDKLVETAGQIESMGSNILKISLSPYQYGINSDAASSLDVVKLDSFDKALKMKFRYIFCWVYNPACEVPFLDGLSEDERNLEYRNMYDLASYLFKEFDGTDKEFYLGHWEGDWHLTITDANVDRIPADRLQGMIDWLKIRQKAIDDASDANPASSVKVYHYSEVNRVFDASNKGFERVVNKVLPAVDVDYVSYSCYDALQRKEDASLMDEDLRAALDYIEQNLPAKESVPGKRVFIGEYGFPSLHTGEKLQDTYSRNAMKSAISWGCPFVIYWEMYNNEVSDGGTHNGFWLINNRGVKQQIYYTHFDFYARMKKFVHEYNEKNGKLPSAEEFRNKAVSIL